MSTFKNISTQYKTRSKGFFDSCAYNCVGRNRKHAYICIHNCIKKGKRQQKLGSKRKLGEEKYGLRKEPK